MAGGEVHDGSECPRRLWWLARASVVVASDECAPNEPILLTNYMCMCTRVWGVQWKWREDQLSLADG